MTCTTGDEVARAMDVHRDALYRAPERRMFREEI